MLVSAGRDVKISEMNLLDNMVGHLQCRNAFNAHSVTYDLLYEGI